MKINFLKIAIYLFVVILFIVFHAWFSASLVTSGDWVYYFPQAVKDIHFLAAWDSTHYGMGASVLPTLWIESYFDATVKASLFIGWALYEKIFWFLPFLFFSVISSYLLIRKLFPSLKFPVLSSFLYTLNTYALLIIGGGQVGVALAYAFAPFVILSFVSVIEDMRLKKSLVLGATLALLVLFDIRIAYVTIFALALYFIIYLLYYFHILRGSLSKLLLYCIVFPGFLAGFLNAFWLLPVAFVGRDAFNQFGAIYSSTGSVQFFSFAKIENSIGFLHPYWPDNIFGKVSFMKPEFLILPILAFASLLCVNKKNRKQAQYILSFALIGLIGVFLAKGSTDPFGFIYLWMFAHVPGFIMFRDPTKWYVLIAFSYSILIPFTVWQGYEWLLKSSKFKIKSSKLQFKIQNYLPQVFLILVIGFLLFLIRPALFGQLGGTLQTRSIPSVYIEFEQFLSGQPQFSRTLWVPTTQRFGFFSSNHPAISAQDYFSLYNNLTLLHKLSDRGTEKQLEDSGVQYVIVPDDFQGEIFLKNRKYDQNAYLHTIASLQKISWLKKLTNFGNIVVFAVPHHKDHFWSSAKQSSVTYKISSPTSYLVSVTNAKKDDLLVFSESYDPNWIAKNSIVTIHSAKFESRLNSFVLPSSGNYTLEIFYTPQEWVDVGFWISLVAVVLLGGSLIALRSKIKDLRVKIFGGMQ